MVPRRSTGKANATAGNIIRYRGYIAKIEFDQEEKIFHGRVINLRDVVNFEGSSAEELIQAMQESIEDYIEFCRQRGE